jgi:hypothetical protein
MPVLPPFPIPSRRRTRSLPGLRAPDIGRAAPAEAATLAELRRRALRERLQRMLAEARGAYGQATVFPAPSRASLPPLPTPRPTPYPPDVVIEPRPPETGGPIETGVIVEPPPPSPTSPSPASVSYPLDTLRSQVEGTTRLQIEDYLGALFAEAQRAKFLEDLANSLTRTLSTRIRLY